MNTYILVFDRNNLVDYSNLLNSIKNDDSIHNWWHYLLSCYILISPISASQLTDRIRSYIPGERFLIMQVNAQNFNGWLPKDAWEWIRNNVH